VNNLALTRLLQLASPALPVGAYSYSQGLEAAVEAGMVRDATSAQRWIGDMLRLSVARLEAPVWRRLHAAWAAADINQVQEWNDYFLATRETAELRAETLQMGWSLRRLCMDLGEFDAPALAMLETPAELAFPAAYTFAVVQWDIPERDALTAYLWSWLENQVMAALKAVPLGQTEGQRLLVALSPDIVIISEDESFMEEHEMTNYSHGLAISSSVHETQYSRLFRS
jgi:urease accessory protein